MSWNGTWDSGATSDEIISTVDLLPTIAHYAGAQLPINPIDGINISAHLENTDQSIDRNYVLYTKGMDIYGIRLGVWKYLPYSGARKPTENSPPELFNLKEDISETTNLYNQHPDIVSKLSKEIEKHRKKMQSK